VRAPAVDADLRLTLVAALRTLPPRSRAVVVLRYLEDHSIESVAELMDATPAAVKSLNTRGLAQLRELLSGDQQHLLQP
jgi:RNA polymerase sigma factor (sigma-70 family)